MADTPLFPQLGVRSGDSRPQIASPPRQRASLWQERGSDLESPPLFERRSPVRESPVSLSPPHGYTRASLPNRPMSLEEESSTNTVLSPPIAVIRPPPRQSPISPRSSISFELRSPVRSPPPVSPPVSQPATQGTPIPTSPRSPISFELRSPVQSPPPVSPPVSQPATQGTPTSPIDTAEMRFTINAFCVLFKRQQNGTRLSDVQIVASSVEEFCNQVWNTYSSSLVGEIKSSTRAEDGSELPSGQFRYYCDPRVADQFTLQNYQSFFEFKDGTAKRSFTLGTITEEWLLRKIRSFPGATPILTLRVYKYGPTATKQTATEIEARITAQEHANRAGASNEIRIDQIVSRLQEVHRQNFTAPHYAWRIWASRIAEQRTDQQEQLIAEYPPNSIIRFFGPVTAFGSAAGFLHEQRDSVQIAVNAITGIKALTRIEHSISTGIKELHTVCDLYLNSLQVLNTVTTRVLENAESVLESSLVTDHIDVDHIY